MALSTSMRRCSAKPSPGNQGDTNARICLLSLEPEMVSIAGIYDTGDPPAHQGLHGQPAQVSPLLGPDGDRFVIDRISR